MKIWDISMTIENSMPVWKGREAKRPIVEITRDFSKGDVARETRLSFDMHTGTHIDAPLHFVENGETMENLKLEDLLREVSVLDLSHVEDAITADDLRSFKLEKGDFILLKTKNSFEDILEKDFIYITTDAAKYLAELEIKGVGIDSLGVERDQPDHGTHNALLGAKIIIIEGLRLKEVEEGEYFMIAAPLKVGNLEAAPTRVLLTELKK